MQVMHGGMGCVIADQLPAEAASPKRESPCLTNRTWLNNVFPRPGRVANPSRMRKVFNNSLTYYGRPKLLTRGAIPGRAVATNRLIILSIK